MSAFGFVGSSCYSQAICSSQRTTRPQQQSPSSVAYFTFGASVFINWAKEMNVTSSIVPFHAGGRVLVEFDNGEMKVKGVEKNLPKGEENFNIVVLDVKLLRE